MRKTNFSFASAIFILLSLAPAALATPADWACDLWDDEQGVPHVRADKPEALFACLGYVHGRDRAWQMDYFRRTSQGRRAEIFGPDHLRSDFQMRLLDLPGKAATLFQAMKESDRRPWQAYASGVNQGIRAALSAGVFEFKHWNYEPEPWMPEDSLSLLLLQAFDQTRRGFAVQLEEQRQLEHNQGKKPSPSPPIPWDTSILKPGEYELSRASSATHTSSDSTEPRSLRVSSSGFFAAESGAGSNNWVIAPGRSRTGNALLANDPHLGLGYPPLWHISHIESPQVEAFGAAMPGIPVIVSGANQHAAWGLTNSFLQVARISTVPETDLKDSIITRPWIWVKLWKFRVPYFLKTFRRTRSGLPILPLEAPKGQAIVLTWTGFDLEPGDISGLFDLMASRSARDLDRALGKIRVPSWNFVFADTRGEIGYRAVGRVPRVTEARPLGIGRLSLMELEKEWREKKLLSEREMPHAWNPTRGYLVTANNRQWPSAAAFHGGWGYRAGFRAFRIEELLTRAPKQDLTSFSGIQCDTQAVDARFLLPLLLSSLKPGSSEGEKRALSLLQAWKDAQYGTGLDCRACGVFRLWINRLLDRLVMDEAALYRKLQSDARLELEPSIRNAFEYAVSELAPKDFPAWGALHRNSFPHLGDEALFTDVPLPTPGDDETVNPGTSRWAPPFFRHTAGASQRLIVELSKPPVIHSILPGPNRGLLSAARELNSPSSPWTQWRDCKLQKRLFPVNWNAVPSIRLNLR